MELVVALRICHQGDNKTGSARRRMMKGEYGFKRRNLSGIWEYFGYSFDGIGFGYY